MNKLQAVSIIRNKGQLTLPEAIRKALGWVSPMSAVNIYVTKPDEIVIKPHQTHVDWDAIWDGIKKSRATKGKGATISAAEFLEQDRKRH
jgi:bifunctional DNA-binding transcriptional regulator/antitoxin component of YhaV-PrlF toxin-antitoxin module